TAAQIRRAALRLSRSLDDLADTLQVDAGSIRLDERIVDLREVLARTKQVWGGGSSPAGIPQELRVFAPPSPVWVYIDAARMERVMINLVSKIFQFLPQGGRVDLSLSVVKG